MKNKKIIALMCFLIVLLVIPIFWVATKAILNLPKMDSATIESANKEESKRLFSEKDKFAQEHTDIAGSSIEYSQSFSEKEDGDDMHIAEEKKQINEKLDATVKIIKRYYEKEFNELQNDLERELEENKHKLVDLNEKILTDSEKKLFDLVLTIIENEKLSDEEKSLLLDYLEIDRVHMNKDENLKARADKVFEENK